MTIAAAPLATMAGPASSRRVFGEPIGLAFLALTEAWERFSYYGMTGILPLYMARELLLPGHVEHIAGFQPFRAGLEAVFGPMTPLALASQIFGLYAGLVYFTPVIGGVVADRWIGRRRAVMLGAALMSGGHIAMAFDASFLLALTLLVIGCGLLKGNISAQVGQLYRTDDADGRSRGFAIFSAGINLGAILGPLVCGLLGQVYGWHYGFAAAGVLMLLGLATYIAGYRFMPAERASGSAGRTTLTRADGKVIAFLLLIMVLTIPNSVIYYQNANIALTWIDANVDLTLFGFHVPVTWFNAIDPLVSVLGVPPLLAWWKRQAARGAEPSEIVKITIGLWIAVAANVILWLAASRGGRVAAICPIAYDALLGISFLYYWPTLLALVSRRAPMRVNATMMGVVFLSLFVSYSLIGWIGTFYERIGPVAFWELQVAIGVGGGVALAVLKRPIEQGLARSAG